MPDVRYLRTIINSVPVAATPAVIGIITAEQGLAALPEEAWL